MKIRLQLVVVATGLSLLTGCASTPFLAPESGSPTAFSSPTAPSVSPAKERLATASPTPSATAPTGSATPGSAQRSAVIWADYESDLQSSIDQATVAGDCNGINTYFGMTTATEDSVKARTGHGNAAVVAYLDEALVLANCG